MAKKKSKKVTAKKEPKVVAPPVELTVTQKHKLLRVEVLIKDFRQELESLLDVKDNGSINLALSRLQTAAKKLV